MEPIHRADGELCGFVRCVEGRWEAVAVFGSRLKWTSSRAMAEQIVREIGLASLADRWVLTSRLDGREQVVCVQEASPNGVTVALDYYSMPGVPTLRITREQIDGGEYSLRRA